MNPKQILDHIRGSKDRMLSASKFEELMNACVFFSYTNGYISQGQAHDLICPLDTKHKFNRLLQEWKDKEAVKHGA